MPDADLLSTAEVAEMLGILPRSVAQRVQRGTLMPALKLPGQTGAYLFDRDEIEALAADSAEAAAS